MATSCQSRTSMQAATPTMASGTAFQPTGDSVAAEVSLLCLLKGKVLHQGTVLLKEARTSL
ncbi:MAG: hypothetical protein LBT62_05420 [Deltaproteobacteria bacterium]|nr:hypothetical protein [Deltaproteobacteria bacterium]